MVRRLLVLLLAVSCATAPPKQQAALFEMHSDFWLNMHHFVRAVGRGMPAEGELTPVEREAWMAAVEYYKAHYLERDLLEDEMVAIKEALRIANNNADLSGAAIDPQLREILERAEPVYRAHWWPQHDAANRAWIAAAEPRVARYGPQIADAIAKANEETWFATPVPLDLSVTAGPNGAYTTLGPRTTMSALDPGYQGFGALEMVFHEASHAWGRKLNETIRTEFAAHQKQAPPQLWHAVLFYTAGELTRRTLAADGQTYVALADRQPRIYGAFCGDGCRDRIAAAWNPRLDGKISQSEAADRLAASWPQ